MFFSTERIMKEWVQQASDLNKYYCLMQERAFGKAMALIERLIEEPTTQKQALSDEDTDAVYNDYYLFLRLLDLLKNYSMYWRYLCEQKCKDSWDSLQDVQDYLRVLRKFGNERNIPLLNFIESQCGHLEEIYPYRMFMSIEAKIKKATCSICGKNPYSLDCPHIMNELYRGICAVCIVDEFESLGAVAFVDNPEDKRCVICIEDDAPDFRIVRYLAKIVNEGKTTPFQFFHVKKRKIRVAKKTGDRVGQNALCPCGSGKKHKKCCMNKSYYEKDHLDIIGQEDAIIEPHQFACLSWVLFDKNS